MRIHVRRIFWGVLRHQAESFKSACEAFLFSGEMKRGKQSPSVVNTPFGRPSQSSVWALCVNTPCTLSSCAKRELCTTGSGCSVDRTRIERYVSTNGAMCVTKHPHQPALRSDT